MKILLVRTKPTNLFNKLNIVTFEPLELEYLAAAAAELHHETIIYDGQIEHKPFAVILRECQPDFVAITGYTIDVNRIKSYAELVKTYRKDLPVIVGGIHAELNWQDFFHPDIDIIVYANPIEAFKQVICALEQNRPLFKLPNICVRDESGTWQKNTAEKMDPNVLPLPDRTHLLIHHSKFRYYGQEECALLKTAWGCCYSCSYCYCTHLNQGEYACRNLQKVMAEIQGLPQKKIFILDDTFLVGTKRVLEFCRLIREHRIDKSFSIYARADYITLHASLLPQLRSAGIAEIIIGLESMDDKTLNQYNKGITSEKNMQAIKLLRKHHIQSTALFIVDHHYSVPDFKRLRQTVKLLRPDLCMFSIFTPLPGTPEFRQYEEDRTIDPSAYEAYDFLHLTLQPQKLSVRRFYLEFYKLYLSSYLNWYQLRQTVRLTASIVSSLLKEGAFTLGKTCRKPFVRRFINIWDLWATCYDRLWVQKHSLAPTRKLLLTQISAALNQNKKQEFCLLDVGCGTGQFLQDVLSVHGQLPQNCVGLDASEQMIAVAKEKQVQGVTFLCADALQLPFADGSFDFVTCSHSLPYYPDQIQAIREFWRVLKPEGVLLVVNASVNNWYDRLTMTLVKLTTGKAHYPSAVETSALLQQQGFAALKQQRLQTKFYMPSIILTSAVKGHNHECHAGSSQTTPGYHRVAKHHDMRTTGA